MSSSSAFGNIDASPPGKKIRIVLVRTFKNHSLSINNVLKIGIESS